MSAGNIPFIEMPKEQLRHLDPQNFYFGKSFTNYMLEADYKDGAWTNAVIKKFEPLQIDPSTAVLHYCQSIFEGIKAYKLQMMKWLFLDLKKITNVLILLPKECKCQLFLNGCSWMA